MESKFVHPRENTAGAMIGNKKEIEDVPSSGYKRENQAH
jgi:hypothetical protein